MRVEGSDERPVVAEVYVAVPTPSPGLPSAQYVGYLVAAAAEVGLPKTHLDQARRPHAGVGRRLRRGRAGRFDRAGNCWQNPAHREWSLPQNRPYG